jgi:hypothetical protein
MLAPQPRGADLGIHLPIGAKAGLTGETERNPIVPMRVSTNIARLLAGQEGKIGAKPAA